MANATHFSVAVDAKDGEGRRRVYIDGNGKPAWKKGERGHGKLTPAEVKTVRAWAKKKWHGTARVIVEPVAKWTHVSGDVEGLSPKLMDLLDTVGRDLGKTVYVKSGKRDPEEQKRLYAAFLARGKRPPLVAAPGHSNHERGTAADAQIDGRSIGKSDAAVASLKRHGGALPVIGEPWHVEVYAQTKPANRWAGVAA